MHDPESVVPGAEIVDDLITKTGAPLSVLIIHTRSFSRCIRVSSVIARHSLMTYRFRHAVALRCKALQPFQLGGTRDPCRDY